ncbi:MAG: hypothetical protein VX015_14435 [Planctomycetota bacterium]|nr:hypothetical protein [Planctomycetota bacterium]
MVKLHQLATRVVAFAALTSAAAAQSTLDFEIDAAATQFTYSGSTSLGPIVGNPASFGLSGNTGIRLSGAPGALPFAAELPGTGTAVVAPDINATIPNPLPFLPPLATVSITNLTFSFSSPSALVDGAGNVTLELTTTATSGIFTVAPLAGSQTVTDLSGSQSTPQPFNANISVIGTTTRITGPLNITFQFTDPASGITGTFNLAGAFAAEAIASLETITPVPLDFNFNGICHPGEDGNPDDPNGFRAISDRALDFTAGVPANQISDPFVLQDQAGALDIVHLGNRNAVTNGLWAFEATADGDDIGTQPNWLLDPDQSVPQVTNLATPIPIGSNAEGRVLFQISDGGGSFDVFFSLQSGGSVFGTVSGDDWFNGTFLGRGAVDAAVPSFNLKLEVGTIDLSAAAGDSITAVSFSNSSNANGGVAILAVNVASVGLGTNYCVSNANSSGSSAVMGARGSSIVANNNLTLQASGMPANQFGIFVVAASQNQIPLSNGFLCITGTIGRYVGPGQIRSTGTTGAFELPIDLQAIPQGGGTAATNPGQTWNFQAWFRDGVGAGSDFTDGISITFQ